MSEARAMEDGPDDPADRRRAKAGGIHAAQLKSVVERIERLEEEKRTIADDIKEVYGEAKSHGFDTKTLRRVIRIRKEDTHERAEREALLGVYLHALGMAPAA
jgi:uncharacterized protein (UPF0335 family)